MKVANIDGWRDDILRNMSLNGHYLSIRNCNLHKMFSSINSDCNLAVFVINTMPNALFYTKSCKAFTIQRNRNTKQPTVALYALHIKAFV
jgi:hypothetical protein